MAEAQSGGSWWSSVITAAKEKSVTALSATKRDLAEFMSVVSNDTSVAVKHAGMNIKGLMQTEDPDDSASGRSTHSRPPLSTSTTSSPPLGVPYDRSQAQIFTLQSSAATFLTDPLGVESEYQAWTEQFDVQSCQSEISQLLVNCPHVRTMHGQLVPAKVSYENFWQRYFFKLGLLQQEEQRRADLMARVQPSEDLQWEELEEGEGGGEERGTLGEREEEEGKEKGKGREDDVVEIGSSIIDIKSEHLRSESSDSFVCVSEDLPHSEGSHTSPDRNGAGDWEYLKMAEVGEGRGRDDVVDVGDEVVTPVKCDGQRVGGEWEGGDVNSVTVERGGEGEERAVTVKLKTGDDKEDSDWESWED